MLGFVIQVFELNTAYLSEGKIMLTGRVRRLHARWIRLRRYLVAMRTLVVGWIENIQKTKGECSNALQRCIPLYLTSLYFHIRFSAQLQQK